MTMITRQFLEEAMEEGSKHDELPPAGRPPAPITGHFAIVARAKDLVVIPERYIALDAGMNVFNVVTDDLDGLLAHLKERGVTVDEVRRLDQLAPVDPKDSVLLPGEAPEVLLELNQGQPIISRR